MSPRRRRADKCIALRIYEMGTPYIQLIGWVGVAVPVMFTAFTFVSSAIAFGDRIDRLEASNVVHDKENKVRDEKLSNIDGKLDIIIRHIKGGR